MSAPAGSSSVQAPLWSARSRDWAEIQEHTAQMLYRAALAALKLPAGTAVLDAGCGSGVFGALAAAQGCAVTGLDTSDALLALARARVPGAVFSHGDLEQLPFANTTFDVVTGFNSFQYAATPLTALHEAYRVLKPGGRLVMATWGRPEDCEAAPYLKALGALLPPPPPGAPGPFALSADGAMVALTAQAGFRLLLELQTLTIWSYPDEDTAVRGLLSAGPAVRAINHAGEAAVTKAVREVLAPFKRPSGQYVLRNVFRYVIVQR